MATIASKSKQAISRNIQKGRKEIQKLVLAASSGSSGISTGISTGSSNGTTSASNLIKIHRKYSRFTSLPHLHVMHNNLLLNSMLGGSVVRGSTSGVSTGSASVDMSHDESVFLSFLTDKNERNEIDWNAGADDGEGVDVSGNDGVVKSSSWKDVILDKKTKVHKNTIPVKLILNAPDNVKFTTLVKGKEI